MTSQELKVLLETIADSLESLKNIVQPDITDKIIAFLNNLDRTSMDLIITLLKGSYPNLTQQDLVENVQKITEILGSTQNMIKTGQVDDLVDKCRSLQNKPLVLTIISKFF